MTVKNGPSAGTGGPQLASGRDAAPEFTRTVRQALRLVLAVSCAHCGHTLTDPVSVARGVGPKCGARG